MRAAPAASRHHGPSSGSSERPKWVRPPRPPAVSRDITVWRLSTCLIPSSGRSYVYFGSTPACSPARIRLRANAPHDSGVNPNPASDFWRGLRRSSQPGTGAATMCRDTRPRYDPAGHLRTFTSSSSPLRTAQLEPESFNVHGDKRALEVGCGRGLFHFGEISRLGCRPYCGLGGKRVSASPILKGIAVAG